MPFKLKENKTTIEDVINKNKGKLILVDFWASWCSPCREEIPLLEKLKNKYKNQNVIFLCLSFDNDADVWRNASANEGLQNSYLIIDTKKSDFVNKYSIQTIPRYILIGKDGKIISADAPHPSDKALQGLIEKNL